MGHIWYALCMYYSEVTTTVEKKSKSQNLMYYQYREK